MGFRANQSTKIFLMSETGSVLISKGDMTFMKFRIMLFVNMHRHEIGHIKFVTTFVEIDRQRLFHSITLFQYYTIHWAIWMKSLYDVWIVSNNINVSITIDCYFPVILFIWYLTWKYFRSIPINTFHRTRGRVIYIVIVTYTEVSCSISCWWCYCP